MKLFVLAFLVLFAQGAASSDVSRDLPIHIKGGTFKYTPAKNGPGKILFSNGVEIKQGTAEASADRLTALLDPETKQVSAAIAEGNVRVREANRVAVAQRAEFIRGSGTIILTGAARLWEKGNLVEGRQIIFNLEDGTVDCLDCTLVLEPERLGETLGNIPGSQGKKKTGDGE